MKEVNLAEGLMLIIEVLVKVVIWPEQRTYPGQEVKLFVFHERDFDELIVVHEKRKFNLLRIWQVS